MIRAPRANERRSQPARPALLALALAAVAAVALLAAACSGSSSEGVAEVDTTETTTTTSSDSQGGSGSADMAAFNACIRRQGVPLSAAGSSRFEAAKTACARFLPRDSDDTVDPRDRAEQLQLVLRYAACMRRNGLPNFPDPELNPDGYVKIDPEELTALGLDPNSPKYREAEEACKDLEPQ